MKCSELMKTDVTCVAANDAVFVAAQKMREKNVGFLPVCDDARNILGTITDRDITLRVVADCCSPNLAVGDVMTKEAITCRASDDVHSAEKLMARHHKSRMMCVDDAGKLVGVISLSDIAEHEKSNRRVKETLHEVSHRETRP